MVVTGMGKNNLRMSKISGRHMRFATLTQIRLSANFFYLQASRRHEFIRRQSYGIATVKLEERHTENCDESD